MTVLAQQPLPQAAAGAPRLLAGPDPRLGAESLDAHRARLGARPRGGPHVVDMLESSGLRGRGGAAFPAGRKWRSVAQRSAGDAVVVVNASEGEIASAKDRTLVAARPHLVLDGAAIAAESVRAQRIVVYVGQPFREARSALQGALRERRRRGDDPCPVEVVAAPHRYVAGEASAAVHRVDGGPAKPQSPPRPHERGVGGRPTLVQNAETTAHAALVARFGPEWFRQAGTATAPGTALLTVRGAVLHPGVVEVPLGTTIAEAVALAGGLTAAAQAVLLGGYFGTWIAGDVAHGLPLDDAVLRETGGASLGCGLLVAFPQEACGLAETASILEYLAGESAGQCGPCVHGLPALAGTLRDLVDGDGGPGDVGQLRRWSDQIRGRGGCHHPDGAIRLLESALRVFAADLESHLRGRPCRAARHHPLLPARRGSRWWR